MALIPLLMPLVAEVTGIAGVVNILAQWLVLHRLRLVHCETWQSLGRPTLFTWPYGKVGAASRRFIWSFNHVAGLEDSALLVLQKVMKVSGYAFPALFVCYWLLAGLHGAGHW